MASASSEGTSTKWTEMENMPSCFAANHLL
jgi:hypothetical protein